MYILLLSVQTFFLFFLIVSTAVADGKSISKRGRGVMVACIHTTHDNSEVLKIASCCIVAFFGVGDQLIADMQ